MNELSVKENIKIKNMIYEIRSKQVMLDKEISITKCYDSRYDGIVTH